MGRGVSGIFKAPWQEIFTSSAQGAIFQSSCNDNLHHKYKMPSLKISSKNDKGKSNWAPSQTEPNFTIFLPYYSSSSSDQLRRVSCSLAFRLFKASRPTSSYQKLSSTEENLTRAKSLLATKCPIFPIFQMASEEFVYEVVRKHTLTELERPTLKNKMGCRL